MLDALRILSWRVATPQEVAEFLRKKRQSKAKRSQRLKRNNILVIRSKMRPVDIYAYLRARFGAPNGIQNLLRRDDSDNLFHWDFNIRSGNEEIYIVGASREVHIHAPQPLSDKEWLELIDEIKKDFKRVDQIKGNMQKTFEKFYVFQNKYVAIANACANLHASITDATPLQIGVITNSKRELNAELRRRKRASTASEKLYGDCLQLALLTPIMAEAYINMIILIFGKSDLKTNRVTYDAFLREKIPIRIALTHERCIGFKSEIDSSSELYKSFMTVINKRNFALHGNVDPVAERLETLYFEGKRPLFEEPGDNIAHFLESLERVFKPKKVVEDYEQVHGFLAQIRNSLLPTYQEFFDQVIDDAFPGFDVKRRHVTRILPDNIALSFFGGVLYDDQLVVA